MSNARLVYLRGHDKTPVGCVAFMDLDSNSFTYGVSFFNFEDGQAVSKETARHVARERLKLALIPVERKHCQGRFGTISVNGKTLNQKVADLLEKIARLPLHGRDEVRLRMVGDLLTTASSLRSKKSAAA